MFAVRANIAALRPHKALRHRCVIGRVLRTCSSVVLALWCLIALTGCGPGGDVEIEVRIANVSQFGFTEVSISDVDFGDVPIGATSDYKTVRTNLRYAVVKLTADGRNVTGQTLNLGANRFTYEVDVVDLLAGQLKIEVVPEEDP
jgi:hypothetical protein